MLLAIRSKHYVYRMMCDNCLFVGKYLPWASVDSIAVTVLWLMMCYTVPPESLQHHAMLRLKQKIIYWQRQSVLCFHDVNQLFY